MAKKIIILLILLVLVSTTVYTQKFSRGKARVNGIITDEAGNPLAGALIIMTHEDRVTKFKQKSNKKGKWGIIGLGTGEFIVDITLEGYVPFNTLIKVSQLSKNPVVKAVMKKVKETVVQENLKPKLEEAEKLFKAEKYNEALKIYSYVLEKAPKVYQIIFKVADCKRGLNKSEEALKAYEQGIKMALDKKDIASAAQAYGFIGGMYVKKNDAKTANIYFKKSIALNPKDAVLAYNVAEINFNSMNTDEAIKYYMMAIKIKPNWAPPYKQIGYAYLNKNDMKKAVEMFKKFIELEPNSQDAAIVKQVIQSLPK